MWLYKYGRNQVAQIITYGSMAARTSIQDVGRVLDMPLSEVTLMKKLVPETLGITLRGAIDQVPNSKLSLKARTCAVRFCAKRKNWKALFVIQVCMPQD